MARSDRRLRKRFSLRRLAAKLLIAAYLGSSVWFLLGYALGDRGFVPLSYFWTWDMYPYYFCESYRWKAVGRTNSGAYLQLLPGPGQKFRWGVHGDLPRTDLDGSGAIFNKQGRNFLRDAAEKSLELTRQAHADDPIVHVYLLKQFWPVRFNYPEETYARLYDWLPDQLPQESVPGSPTGRPVAWKVIREFDVPADVEKKEAPQ